MTRHAFLLFALAAFLAGCVSTRVVENTRVPEIAIDELGKITFNNKPVKLEKLASAVKSAGIRRDQEVNILLPDSYDQALRNAVCMELVRHGYTRTVFVKNRKATATVREKK